MTFNEQVNTVLSWFDESPESVQTEFKNTPKDDLGVYYNTLGMRIRDELKLWEVEWEPEVKDGIDYSPDHPDAKSSTIIKAVWLRMQERD